LTRAARLECEKRWKVHRANPFFVLGVGPDATRAQIEREGAKLLAMLASGIEGAGEVETPLGPISRDAESIRAALAELRDPERRLAYEWWARGLAEDGGTPR
jgi:hypothetical protein